MPAPAHLLSFAFRTGSGGHADHASGRADSSLLGVPALRRIDGAHRTTDRAATTAAVTARNNQNSGMINATAVNLEVECCSRIMACAVSSPTAMNHPDILTRTDTRLPSDFTHKHGRRLDTFAIVAATA